MRKNVLLWAIISTLILLTACGKEEAVPDYEQAVGIIIVNDRETIGQESKLYASYADHQYTYDLDAAVIYFFRYDSETSYAGGYNVTSLTFKADVDNDAVGAEATIAYIDDEASGNTVTAYYLYYDGIGLYFEPDEPFSSVSVNGTAVIEGIDYASKVTVTADVPTDYFVVTCYRGSSELQAETIDPEEFEDYSKYLLPDGTDRVEIASYNDAGDILDRTAFHQGEGSYTVAYDAGGQIMGAKTLYLVWPE